MASTKKVLLITGCSSGLGFNLVQHFLTSGHSVVVTARDVTKVTEFESKYPKTALALALDVTDQKSIADAVLKAVEKFGRIDVLINNAGFNLVTAAANFTAEEARKVMDTNFFGAMFTSQAVLPVMRKQHSGTIIQVTSTAGLMSFPGMSIYSASKCALEGFSEGLAQEVASHNIRVIIAEPGTFKTSIGEKMLLPSNPNVDDYPVVKQLFDNMHLFKDSEEGDPKRFAVAIEKLLELENPPLRIPFGSTALAMVHGHIQQQLEDLEKFKDLAVSTDFDPIPEAALAIRKMFAKK